VSKRLSAEQKYERMLKKARCKIRQCNVSELPKVEHVKPSRECDDPENCVACYLDYANDAYYPDDDDGYLSDRDFADPGGRSALRAENVYYTYGPDGEQQILCSNHPCHARLKRTDNFCRKCGQEALQRNQPCPDCGCPDMLTAEDRRLRYRCDHCADRAEGYGGYYSACSGGY